MLLRTSPIRCHSDSIVTDGSEKRTCTDSRRESFSFTGKIWFGADEWAEFSSTVPDGTKLVGVRIRRQNEIKLFRYGSKPVLRGTAIIVSDRMANL